MYLSKINLKNHTLILSFTTVKRENREIVFVEGAKNDAGIFNARQSSKGVDGADSLITLTSRGYLFASGLSFLSLN